MLLRVVLFGLVDVLNKATIPTAMRPAIPSTTLSAVVGYSKGWHKQGNAHTQVLLRKHTRERGYRGFARHAGVQHRASVIILLAHAWWSKHTPYIVSFLQRAG